MNLALAPGTLVAGKYRLEKLLGKGGMGSVWTAHHSGLDTMVAVKFMDPALVESSDARSRFEREAKAAAKLRSAHVVQIMDHGIDTEGGQVLPFIVMELLEGEDLYLRLKRRGEIPLPELAQIMLQVGRALSKAHERGIVHRDLKPENIFLVREDDAELVKVLDFGIAKDQKSLATTISGSTRTGTLMGTPTYMSPEQAQGNKSIDHRSDIWSLGVIVFHCLTGILPFDSDGLGDLIIKICVSPIPTARGFMPDLPAAIDGFFAKALARDPDQRFQSARELTAALAQIAGVTAPRSTFADPDTANDRPMSLVAPERTISSAPTLTTATTGILTDGGAKKPGRLIGLAAATIVIFAALGALVVFGLRKVGTPPSSPATPDSQTVAPSTVTAAQAPSAIGATPTVTPDPTAVPVVASAEPTSSAAPSAAPTAVAVTPGRPGGTARVAPPGPAKAPGKSGPAAPPTTKKPRDYGY